jgi:hypothetical protein
MWEALHITEQCGLIAKCKVLHLSNISREQTPWRTSKQKIENSTGSLAFLFL